MTSQALLIARRTGFPCFHLDDKAQVGDTFGERLGNAMKFIYDQGAENLIVIGNDSPDLQTKTLFLAADKLAEGKTVFGPSADGGTYLIGMSRLRFNLKTFVSLPWQQKDLLQELIQWNISLGGSPVFLKSKLDLDNLADCRSWLGRSKFMSSRIQQLLLSFVSLAAIVRRAMDVHVFRIRYAVPFNKGSPSLNTFYFGN